MRNFFVFMITIIVIAIVLWFGIAFLANRDDYISLLRGGLLLLGLAGIGWGLVWHRRESVGVGIGLLMIGLGTFYLNINLKKDQIGQFIWHVKRGFMKPLPIGIPFAYLTVLALLIGNAMMLHRRFGAYHIFTANILLITAAVSMAVFMGLR